MSQQLGLLVAQRQQLGHDGRVVEAGGFALCLIAGARHVCAIELFPQRAAAGKLHHRQVAGHLEGEFVTGLAVCLGRRARGLLHIRRHPFEVFW